MPVSTLKVEGITITFADGSSLIVDQHEWEQAWDDVREGRPNELFERMKAERDRGNTDNGGMIYLLEAYDPKVIKELWENDKSLNADVP